MTWLFLRYFEISLSLTPFILLLLVFSKYANKKYRPKWKSLVWLLIGLRMALPVTFSKVPAPIKLEVPSPALSRLPRPNISPMNDPLTAVPIKEGATTLEQGINTIHTFSWTLLQLIAVIWAFGIIILLVYQFVHYTVFKKSMIRWGRTNNSIQNSTSNYREQNKKKYAVRVLINEKAYSPLVLGFFRKYLILPHSQYSDTQLKYIIQHELNHITKKHIWYKLFVLITTSIHWFNPVVWFMRWDVFKSLEISCDTDIAEHCSKEQIIEYGNTILNCVCHQAGMIPTLATSLGTRKKGIGERINILTNLKNKKNGNSLVAISLAVIICTGSLVGCTVNQTKPSLGKESYSYTTGSNSYTEASSVTESQADNFGNSWADMLQKQQNKFAQYAKNSGAKAGYHVESVVVNTQLIPQGVDPHGFLVFEENNSLHQLIAQRDTWLNEGVNSGWLAGDKRELESEVFSIVYNENMGSRYISRVIPASNTFFDTEFFRDKHYIAFEFENGEENDMLWFYDQAQKKLIAASSWNWMHAEEIAIDVYFELDDAVWDEVEDFIGSVSSSDMGEVLENNLSGEPRETMLFARYSPIEDKECELVEYYLINKYDGTIEFAGACAARNAQMLNREPVIWDASYREYLLSGTEVGEIAQSFLKQYKVAVSLI